MLSNSLPRKTKILATIGPATIQADMIKKLIEAGANGFRLNFSHGSHEFFLPIIDRIRSIAATLNEPIAILQDLQGPKIRTGLLADHKPVLLKHGSKFVITIRDVEGDETQITTNYKGITQDAKAGDTVLLNDGAIELKIIDVDAENIVTEVVTEGMLGEKKGMNLPGTQITAPSVTDKDIADARFGVDMQVDYIALSFVRTAWDVLVLKNLLNQWNYPDVKIIAKIEKPEAVTNIREILEVTDGVMVARGDLGVELAAERVPLIQKQIIDKANKSEKLAITATQMLESMVNYPRPTRAEASDVANAILDGTDVLMLSQETATGKYPVGAVSTMATIARYTESDEDIFQKVEFIRSQKLTNFTHAIVQSARAAALEMKARAIVVFTQSGMTAQLASCQRPPCPIYAFTPLEKTYRHLALVWGVQPILFESISNTDALIGRAEEILLGTGAVLAGDVIVIVSGTNPVSGATNMMKIERLS